jgi:CBS domain-containing protein
MMRYDEEFRYGRGRWRRAEYGGDLRDPYPGRPGRHFDAGEPPAGGGRDVRGWSRPEFNVSFGLPHPERDVGYDDYYAHGFGAGARHGSSSVREWRTGETWGSAESDVDRIRARDLMTENPEAVTADTTLADVARRMRDLDVGIIPVVDDPDRGILQGVITDRDIAVRAAATSADMDSARVGDYMSREVSSVDEADTVRDIFSAMKRERVRRVPVTDFTGRLVGIVALADLAVDYAGLDEDRELEVEEVVGRISEPARPRRFGGSYDYRGGFAAGRRASGYGDDYDRHLRDRVRDRWRSIKREARHLLDRVEDRDWRFYDR